MNAKTELELPATQDAQNPASHAPKLVLAALLLAGAAYLGHAWWFNAHYVESNNAQVGGHIIPISPKQGGFVAGVAVQENQWVEAGQLLVSMDERELRARLAQAEAELAQLASQVGRGQEAGQAVAQLASSRAQAQAAAAQVSAAEAETSRASAELHRLQTLLAQKLISAQQFETAQAQAQAANARLLALRQEAQAAQGQVGVQAAALRGADARLLAAQAAREIAAQQLADSQVRAPRAGMISQKTVEVGQLLAAGQAMMTLVPLDDIWVVANLKETQIRDVKVGHPAEVRIDAYGGLVWQAEVESLSPATGAKFTLLPPDNATGNFTKVVQRIPVRLKIQPGQHPNFQLRPGMSALVTISKKP